MLGSFTIGENSKIGAGSVVLEGSAAKLYGGGRPRTGGEDGRPEGAPRWIWIRSTCRIRSCNDIRELQADNLRLHSRILEMVEAYEMYAGTECQDLKMREEIEEHEAV